MKNKICLIDRGQLSEQEEKSLFRLLLTSFSTKFTSLHLTMQEKLDILIYLEQNYTSQKAQPVDYVLKEGHKIIAVLTVSTKIANGKNRKYPLELSKKYVFFSIFKCVLLLTALEHHPGEKEQYIENIAVHENYQKQGIAKALIEKVQAKVKKGDRLSLIVSAKNQHALRLYLKCGFSIVKKKRNFILGILANEPNWIFMEWSE